VIGAGDGGNIADVASCCFGDRAGSGGAGDGLFSSIIGIKNAFVGREERECAKVRDSW
jgi:hypothetical protein